MTSPTAPPWPPAPTRIAWDLEGVYSPVDMGGVVNTVKAGSTVPLKFEVIADSTGGQFIQNWQTPKAPGTCHLVTMTTQDDSSISAAFKLKSHTGPSMIREWPAPRGRATRSRQRQP